MFLLKNFCEKREYIGLKNVWLCAEMFKETKLFMYSSRGNHGYVTKTNKYTRNLRNILLFNLVDTSKPKKTFCEIKSFLGTRFPSSTTISSSAGGTGLQSRCHTRHNAAKAINQNFYHGRPKRLWKGCTHRLLGYQNSFHQIYFIEAVSVVHLMPQLLEQM